MKKEKLRPEEPKSFGVFALEMTRALHDGLLQGGSNEMRAKLYIWLPYYVDWYNRFKNTEE